jgi:4-hydroxybenzoate polyprenyltransferase
VTKSVLACYRLMRLDKPIGILLLLWPTYWALWLANSGTPNWHLIIVFTSGVILMRSAGCIINDIADQRFDKHVARTKNRPLATQTITPRQAWFLFTTLISAAFILVLTLNTFCLILSFAGLLLAIIYPYTKRFLQIPQAILGITFSWGIPMAFAASQNRLPLPCVLLYIACLFWIIAYDTEYAMVDRDDDLKIGIRSSAIWFGQYDRLAVGSCQVVTLTLLFTIGRLLTLKWPFYAGLLLASFLFIYQQTLIFKRKRERCFQAFLNNHWVGAVIWLGILIR